MVTDNAEKVDDIVDMTENLDVLKQEISKRFSNDSVGVLIDNTVAWFMAKKGKTVRRRIPAGTYIKITSGSGYGLDSIKLNLEKGWRRD